MTAGESESRPQERTSQGLHAKLVREIGTPLYVYDLARVRRSAELLMADLPSGSSLLYSLKANPHPAVVQLIADLGLGLEVSSSGESEIARKALRRSTFEAGQWILSTGPGKSDHELGSAIDMGGAVFSVESVAERDRLASAAAKRGRDVEYLVRLNHRASGAGGALRMTGRATPFGIDTDDRCALEKVLRPVEHATPVGLHTYFATNVTDPQLLTAELLGAVDAVVEVCDRTGYRPQFIDLGGGFSAPMAREGVSVRHWNLPRAVTAAVDRHWPDPRLRPELIFESGRHLVATAGTLLTQVVDVKRTRNRTFVVLDAGVQTFGGMSGLGRLQSPRAVPVGWSDVDSGGTEPSDQSAVALVGPLCTPLDVLNPKVFPPEMPSVGSLISIPNVGAYGLSASLVGFLGHQIAAEAVVDGDRVVSVRRLELTSHDLPFPHPTERF